MASAEAEKWAAGADRYADPDTVERALADATLGFVKVSGINASPEGGALVNRALDLARRLGDPGTYWWVAGLCLFMVSAPQHDKERLRLAEELVEKSRTGVNVLLLGWGLWAIAHTFLQFGQRRRAEDVMSEMRTLVEHSRQAYVVVLSMLNDACMAASDGRLEEAVAISRRTLARAEELGIFEYAALWGSTILRQRVHLGSAERALESMLRSSRDYPRSYANDIGILFCLMHLGRHAEVTEMLEHLIIERPGIGSAEDETLSWLDVQSLEVAVLAGHRQAAELLLRRLAGGRAVTNGLFWTTCVARHLGGACAFLDKPDEARKYYQEAMKVCTETKFRPELALTRLQLAELLLEHYPDEKKEALEHLDFAIKEFQDMKMQPSLERALRHKDILKA